MFRHYLKVALRICFRNKGFSLINVAGLAIGMACCVLILLWVLDEVSFDKFHENADDVYLVAAWTRLGSQTDLTSNTPPALAAALAEEYPEIVAATRFNTYSSMAVKYDDKAFVERVHAVDPSFLDIFTFPLAKGDASRALDEPHSLLMTGEMAAKYFGDEDPLGKVIEVDGQYQFTVTGVLEDLPENSSLRFDLLIPFRALADLWNSPEYPYQWTNWNLYTYIQLVGGASYKDVQAKIHNRINESDPEAQATLFLAPYADLYLHGFGPVSGRFPVVVLLAIMALLVLLIACLNFMNTATARSAARAKEIGLRKAAGAQRRDIMAQFYGESFLLSFISLMFALALVELLLPLFNNLVGKNLSLEITGHSEMYLALAGVVLVTGLVAGSYPALYMASFRPAKIFSGIISAGPSKSTFRKSFVVWQFAVSTILVVATMVVHKQLNYVQHRDPGFNKENLVYVGLKGEIKDRHETVKQELLAHPDILSVSAVSRVPTGVYDNGSKWEWEGRPEARDPLVTYYGADVDFLETFGTEMVHGEFFPKDRPDETSVTSGNVVINERFAEIIGADNPVGMQLRNYGYSYTVIGVIKNFNFKPTYWHIGPMMIYQKTFAETNPDRYNFLFARLRPGITRPALDHIQGVCERFNSGFPAVTRFLDDDYGHLYAGERRFGNIIKYSAIVMIFVTCLGLFGLSAYTAEQRTKEIGVRKVLGATVSGIVRLLYRQILTPVLIANVIAWALSYLLLTGWLMTRFAYRTSIGWQPLILASCLTLGMALISISYQAIKASRANPVESLRHE